MKIIFALCGVILLAGAFFAWRALRMNSEFGTLTGAPAVGVEEVVDHPKDFMGRLVAVEAPVREQCKAMGCYFFIHSGTKSLRVELQDIAMNAPMHEGKPALVEGQIVPYGDGYQLWASGVEFK
jgi:hypothetical protein